MLKVADSFKFKTRGLIDGIMGNLLHNN